MKLDIPTFIIGSIDPLQHKTREDITALIQHEVNLYEEGEETDLNRNSYNKAKAYLRKNS